MFRLKCKVDKELEKKDKEINKLKSKIDSLEETIVLLRQKLAAVPPTLEDIKACRMMYTAHQIADRYVHCRDNKYTISQYASGPNYNPEKFQAYAEKKKYKKDSQDTYWVSLKDLLEYTVYQGYFMPEKKVEAK